MKKKSVIFSLVTLCILYLLVLAPAVQVVRLSKGFVRVKVLDNKKVQYKIVSNKTKDWVRLSEIDYLATQAIVISEDWGFYEHNGLDLSQIQEALVDTIEKGKKLRGASTITQQVVKNLFLTNERSLIRKLKELVYSIALEKLASKKKILEVYLNIIQYGDGLYGIKNASKFYFNKTPKELNAKEGAFLAMLLPSPVRYAHSFKQKELTVYATGIIESILSKLVRAKYITVDELERYRGIPFSWEI